ncbi:MAG TPA: hypothetical protein VGE52_21760, partial [Pirellulales bacterium]
IGEAEASEKIAYQAVDLLNADREAYAGKTTLVMGATLDAAAAVVDLAALADEVSGTEIVWCAAGPGLDAASDSPVVAVIADDPLPRRRELIEAANKLAGGSNPAVKFQRASVIERISLSGDDRLDVVFRGNEPEDDVPTNDAAPKDDDAMEKASTAPAKGRPEGPTIVVDRVLALAGRRPNFEMLRELPLSFDRASDATLGVSDKLKGPASEWPLRFESSQVTTDEMDFYILGSKSFGRTGRDSIRAGLDQVRAVFAIIGDRADLDLNLTAGKALREGK